MNNMIKPGIYKEISTGALEFHGREATDFPLLYERDENTTLKSKTDDKKKSDAQLNKEWSKFNKN